LNGLKTRPGLPGTGLATGNCAEGIVFDPATGFDVALVDPEVDLRDAVLGVGEGGGSGRPGFVTSVFGAGSGSGE